MDAVWSAALDYMGVKDASRANFWIIENQFRKDEQRGVFRVQRDMVDDFRAAITLVDQIGDAEGFFQVTQVSGSIKDLD